MDAIRADVAAVGELGDDTVAEVAERIGAVLARSLPGRLLDLLSGVAADVSAELPEGRLEVRVTRRRRRPGLRRPTNSGSPTEAEGDLSARITLRLGEGLKTRVEDGASRESLSVNAYIVRALERSTSQRPRGEPRGHPHPRLRIHLRGEHMERTFDTPKPVRLVVENESGLVTVHAWPAWPAWPPPSRSRPRHRRRRSWSSGRPSNAGRSATRTRSW